MAVISLTARRSKTYAAVADVFDITEDVAASLARFGFDPHTKKPRVFQQKFIEHTTATQGTGDGSHHAETGRPRRSHDQSPWKAEQEQLSLRQFRRRRKRDALKAIGIDVNQVRAQRRQRLGEQGGVIERCSTVQSFRRDLHGNDETTPTSKTTENTGSVAARPGDDGFANMTHGGGMETATVHRYDDAYLEEMLANASKCPEAHAAAD